MKKRRFPKTGAFSFSAFFLRVMDIIGKTKATRLLSAAAPPFRLLPAEKSYFFSHAGQCMPSSSPQTHFSQVVNTRYACSSDEKFLSLILLNIGMPLLSFRKTPIRRTDGNAPARSEHAKMLLAAPFTNTETFLLPT